MNALELLKRRFSSYEAFADMKSQVTHIFRERLMNQYTHLLNVS